MRLVYTMASNERGRLAVLLSIPVCGLPLLVARSTKRFSARREFGARPSDGCRSFPLGDHPATTTLLTEK